MNIPLSLCVPENLVSRDGLPRSTGHIVVLLKKKKKKVMRLYKQWHRLILKRFINPPYSISRATSIDSDLSSPTHGQRSQQQRQVQVSQGRTSYKNEKNRNTKYRGQRSQPGAVNTGNIPGALSRATRGFQRADTGLGDGFTAHQDLSHHEPRYNIVSFSA